MFNESYCIGCGRYFSAKRQLTPIKLLCSECHLALPIFENDRCVITGAAQPVFHAIESIGLSEVRAMYYYKGIVAESVKSFKYGKGLQSLRLLRGLCNNWCSQNNEFLAGYDLLVAVPSHITSLLRRSLNPTAAIIAGASAIKQNHRLVKKIKKSPPMASLSSSERRRVRKSKLFLPRKSIKGLSILVFDDVMTTGSTIENIARCLNKHGAAKVGALVFARNMARTL